MSFYVVPLTGDGLSAKTALAPKHGDDFTASGQPWTWCDFPSNWGVVYVQNAPGSLDSLIQADAECILVPPLGNTIALVATQNALEAMFIPAQWLDASMTYRQVLRGCVAFAQYARKLEGRLQRFDLSGGRLDGTVSQLTQSQRTALQQCATDFRIDTSEITGATKIRELLYIVGRQWVQMYPPRLGDL